MRGHTKASNISLTGLARDATGVPAVRASDEPSSCMELIEFVSAMGHDIVCAGKGKNNP